MSITQLSLTTNRNPSLSSLRSDPLQRRQTQLEKQREHQQKNVTIGIGTNMFIVNS
jgi:hypothetical protein